ncbi:hypothetical protein [Streptomyces sp. NBC_00151]|uniref:hypothetical protein n=1 Tax=Streptomyces sp. NBC_00151 TaxID=2975669 RepID=UPI002DDB00D2|nr:hypothetical protein [Streptomyces sp. NBC_00151]WRZ37260.1 hypothetical protein OG915_03815 [Streptomyces sp. NBC_00151]
MPDQTAARPPSVPPARAAAPSPPAALSARVLGRLTAVTDVTESPTPWGRLTSGAFPGEVGSVRYFTGSGAVASVVHISLVVPPIGLDSHMVFAFGAAEGPLPHFTLDSVHAGEGYAFHLDLVQRADLASHPAYADAVYGPLTPAHGSAAEIPGLAPAAIGPRQRALMSPWMLVHRADEAALRAVGPIAENYLEHWLTLVGDFPPAAADEVKDTDLADRDRRLRAALFSREIDPVWAQVDRLLGPATTDALRGLLITGSPGGAEGDAS